jgi:hypothetical protein
MAQNTQNTVEKEKTAIDSRSERYVIDINILDPDSKTGGRYVGEAIIVKNFLEPSVIFHNVLLAVPLPKDKNAPFEEPGDIHMRRFDRVFLIEEEKGYVRRIRPHWGRRDCKLAGAYPELDKFLVERHFYGCENFLGKSIIATVSIIEVDGVLSINIEPEKNCDPKTAVCNYDFVLGTSKKPEVEAGWSKKIGSFSQRDKKSGKNIIVDKYLFLKKRNR